MAINRLKRTSEYNNRMRNFIFIILTMIIWSCGQKNKPDLTEKFVVKTYSITSDTTVRSTLFYKDHYYCLTEKMQFVCLNNKFQVDSSITNFINQMPFYFSYLSGDTLMAGTYINNKTTETYFLDQNHKWQPTTKMQSYKPFFEDERFIIRTCCMGEFGGAIFFTEKQSKRVYSCPSTCVVNINKINGSYYVTNSLAHMSSSTEILRIDDPTKLYELKADNLKNGCNWYMRFVTSKDGYAGMRKFEIGTQKILDTIGVLTMTSFIYNKQLYHINTDFEKTFISKNQGDSLYFVDSIFNKPLWSYNPENRKYGTMTLYSFNNRKTSGFFKISNDTISIITFSNDRKNNNR